MRVLAVYVVHHTQPTGIQDGTLSLRSHFLRKIGDGDGRLGDRIHAYYEMRWNVITSHKSSTRILKDFLYIHLMNAFSFSVLA